MGLDSIEIVMDLEKSFGIRIENHDAEKLFTPNLVIDYIATKVPLVERGSRPCLTMRAFHSIRQTFICIGGMDRKQIRPDVPLAELLRGKDRQLRQKIGEACCVSMPSMIGGWFSPKTIGELACRRVTQDARNLKPPDEPWTREEIRLVVRAIVTDVTGKGGFSDDAHFIHDLALD